MFMIKNPSNPPVLRENETEWISSTTDGEVDDTDDCKSKQSFKNDDNNSTNENDLELTSSNDLVANVDADIFADEFYNCLDDLENDSYLTYYVEAYNKVGRELNIVQLSAERISVNLNTVLPKNLEDKKESILRHKNDDDSFSINSDSEFVNDNLSSESYSFYTDTVTNRSAEYSIFKNKDRDDYDRRKTFCNEQDIEGATGYGNSSYTRFSSVSSDSRRQSVTRKAEKRTLSYIIEEIKATEINYVNGLTKVVNCYKPYMENRIRSNQEEKLSYIFRNIEILLQNQVQFLTAIQDCGEEVDDVTDTFIKFKNLFKLYPAYLRNKPKSDIYIREFSVIIKEAEEEFNEMLELSSYLITPLQRLGKYKLFLENIEKELIKLDLPTESAKTALEIIKSEMSKGNDYVAIESIENSPINELLYGSFKMREEFLITKPWRMDAMVFLFENLIIFTYKDSSDLDLYVYLDSIKMIDLRLSAHEDLTIYLTDFTRNKMISSLDKYTFVLEAKTESIRNTWKREIEIILWRQLENAKENTLKRNSRHVTDYITLIPESTEKDTIKTCRVKSAGSSIFYIEDYD